MKRRAFLLSALTGTSAIAGCSGSDGGDTPRTTVPSKTTRRATSPPTPTPTSTTSATPTSPPTTTTALPPSLFKIVEASDDETVQAGGIITVRLRIRNTANKSGDFRAWLQANPPDKDAWQSFEWFNLSAGAGETASMETSYQAPSTPGTWEFRFARLGYQWTVDVEPSPTATPTPTQPPVYDKQYARANASEVPYETLFRNFDEYEGEPVHYPYGSIYQVMYDVEEGTDYLQLYVSTNSREWEGDIAAYWSGDTRLLEDDRIELWGVPERLYTYETVEGNERTIPLLTIVDVELLD